ncbi:MAG: hypothetical protein KIT44_12235 [Opitutaceae bacterium]|nr:hypothetical protein [Opitutaceae bacterium]
MISEKQLAEHFDSFWQQHFPLLNPTFIRQLNSEKERLVGTDGQPVLPVKMGKDVDRFDLVAELAFEMAQERYRVRPAGVPDEAKACLRALKRMAAILGLPQIPKPSHAEVAEANALLGVYEVFFATVATSGDIFFRPRIKGAGVLDEMEADFCSSSTLFEVKAVNRNLQSGDLRQVVCYLVAGLGSHQFAWTDYCIFNPRLSIYHSGKIEELLTYVSGRTSHDCIADVLDALMEREQPLESRF